LSTFNSRLSIYNNPLDYIDNNRRGIINEYYKLFEFSNKRIKMIYESIKDVEDISDLIRKYGIPEFKASSTVQLDHNLFRFLGPSEDFYLEKLWFFTDKEHLHNLSLLKRI